MSPRSISAQDLDDALRVLSTFDEGPDLVLHYKQLMVLEGHDAYVHQAEFGRSLEPQSASLPSRASGASSKPGGATGRGLLLSSKS